jgi:hypothetical protein
MSKLNQASRERDKENQPLNKVTAKRVTPPLVKKCQVPKIDSRAKKSKPKWWVDVICICVFHDVFKIQK